jgi:hypothetical protein
MGISDTGKWVILIREGLLAFVDQASDYPGLLPVLEAPRPVFESQLKKALSDLGLPEGLAVRFPIEKVAISALKAWGDCWPALGLEWAETIPASDGLIEILGKLMRDGRTQQIRHRVKRIFFKNRRSPDRI